MLLYHFTTFWALGHKNVPGKGTIWCDGILPGTPKQSGNEGIGGRLFLQQPHDCVWLTREEFPLWYSRHALAAHSDTIGHQYVAASIGIEVSAINLRDASEIEQDVKRFASSPNGGLILTGSALSVMHHNLIIALAAQHKLPTVYYRRYYVTSGGLISYGFDIGEQFRGAARYVDRILKGDKPADLPVQVPTKYELVINLKTAKALGLDVPFQLQQLADEIIE